MKKSFVLIALLLVGFSASAQPSRGDKEVKLSFGIDSFNLYYGDDSSDKLSLFMISPSYQYFTSDKFSFGVALDYARLKIGSRYSKNNYGYDVLSYFALSPIASYHFPIAEKLTFSIDGKLSFGGLWIGSKEAYDADPDNTDLTNRAVHIAFVLAPSFNYYLTKKLTLSLSVGDLGYHLVNLTDAGTNAGYFKAHLNKIKWTFGFRF